MKSICSLFPFLALTSLPIAPAVAAPLDPTHIPAEAQWVAHLDVETLRESQLGQFIIHEIAAKRMPATEGFSVDPVAAMQIIDAVTVYGDEISLDPSSYEKTGVIVVTGNENFGSMVSGLIAYAEVEQKVEVLQRDPYLLVRMDDGTLGAQVSPRQVVLSQSETLINKYLATVSGDHADLAQSGRFENFAVGDRHAILVGRVGGLEKFADAAPQARVFKLSQGLALELGEVTGEVALRTTFDCGNSANAQRVQQILQGLIAITSLTRVDDENLSTLLRSTLVRQREQMVDLEVAFPADRIIEMISAKLPPIEIYDDETGGQALAVEVSYARGSEHCCPLNLGDNDPATGWRVTATELTAEFELAEPQPLRTIEFDWVEGIGEAFGFSCSTSTDGQRWERRIVWDGGGRAPNSVALNGERVRFLKIGFSRPQAGPLGLRAMRLNGQRPALVSARSSAEAWMQPANLFDDDPSTRYEGEGGETVVEGQLADTAIVREIGVLWADAGERQLEVLASSDGIEWQRILAIAQTVSGGELQRFNSKDIRARHVRFRSPDQSVWGQPLEIRVYGTMR